MAHTNHLHSHDVEANGRKENIAYCGYSSASMFYMTTDPNHGWLCPKCSSKYYAAKLAANPIGFRLGDRIDPSSIERERYSAFKSFYSILGADDRLYGYLIIENGWGKHWQIATLRTNHPADLTEENPDLKIERGDTAKIGKRTKMFLSKEEALAAVPDLVEDGTLKPADVVLSEARDHYTKVRLRLLAGERRAKQEEDERREQTETVLSGFQSLISRKDLTNIERESVFAAAKMLGINIEAEDGLPP